MRIAVVVIPGSKGNEKKRRVVLDEEGTYTVRVKERAHDGEANDALCRTLAEHFGVPRSRVAIVRGQRSRKKTVEIR